MNFVEGALWSESSAGTNAIGTAMAAAHAVQVFAAEHFTEPVQRWTCSAAPVMDPDTGRMLGIIDLTGDISVVNPLSLAVVVATARAVEELLRGQLHERDDRLRARYAELLGPASAGAALVTGTGRILLDPGRRWTRVRARGDPRRRRRARAAVRHRGDRRADRRGRRLRRAPEQPRRCAAGRARAWSCACSATSPPEVRLDGEPLRLRPRHVEMLTILALHRGHLNADVMCAELYGDDGHPASVRVEMSRLRRLLPGTLESEGYGLTGAGRQRRPARSRAAGPRRRPRRGRGLPRPAAAGLRRALHRARARRARRLDAPGRHHLRGRRRAVGMGALVLGRRATCWRGSGCSRRWTTPIRAAAWRSRGRARCARNSAW